MHLVYFATDALPEPDADPVVAVCAEGKSRQELGDVLGNHASVEDEAAGA